jgi:hypothetical protein
MRIAKFDGSMAMSFGQMTVKNLALAMMATVMSTAVGG